MATPYAPNDADLIKCAQDAWQSLGKYPLERWSVRLGYTVAVMAYATPPRAKNEYMHAFIFNSALVSGSWVWSLGGIAKAPWHKKLSWQGSRFLKGTVVKYFQPGRWTVEVKAFTPA